MVETTVVQKKHRITIPRDFRRKLRLKEGDTVSLSLEGAKMILKPVWLEEHPTERLSGLVRLKRSVPARQLEEMMYRERGKQAFT